MTTDLHWKGILKAVVASAVLIFLLDWSGADGWGAVLIAFFFGMVSNKLFGMWTIRHPLDNQPQQAQNGDA